MGRQNVGETCETQHAGHGKQSLCNQLRILLFPVLSHCSQTYENNNFRYNTKKSCIGRSKIIKIISIINTAATCETIHFKQLLHRI